MFVANGNPAYLTGVQVYILLLIAKAHCLSCSLFRCFWYQLRALRLDLFPILHCLILSWQPWGYHVGLDKKMLNEDNELVAMGRMRAWKHWCGKSKISCSVFLFLRELIQGHHCVILAQTPMGSYTPSRIIGLPRGQLHLHFWSSYARSG